MKFTIIADSCCDMHSCKINEFAEFISVPLSIIIDGREILDDELLDTSVLAEDLAQRDVKTGCPSPESYYRAMKSGDNVICVTLSSKLSGSYNSARLAAEQIKEEFPEKKLFVLDSLSATAAMVLITEKLKELVSSNQYTFEEVVERIVKFRNKTQIRFILNDLSKLIKTGRISKIAGAIASVLSIKPICGDNGKGEITMYAKALGNKKALMLMCENVGKRAAEEGLAVVITHYDNETDALALKQMLKAQYDLIDVKIVKMRGISGIYTGFRGVCVASG